MKDRSSQLMMEAGIGQCRFDMVRYQYGMVIQGFSRAFRFIRMSGIMLWLFLTQFWWTTLHLNGKSVTLDSLGFDNNDDLLTIGWQRDGRTFDGLIDDVRMWGRPIQSDEVLSLWGGGLGDIGPRAKFLFDNPIYGSEINATVVFNQSISDFNSSTDLDLIGMTLKSSSSEVDSNTSIYNLILEPVSFSESNLSISLKLGSVTGQFGGKNETFSDIINFRPHRIRENDLVLWWELNEGSGTVVSDSSGNGYSGIFNGSWGDNSQSKFGFSHTDFNKLNGQAIRLPSGLNGNLPVCSLSFWVNPASEDFYVFNIDGISPELFISLQKQRPLFTLADLIKILCQVLQLRNFGLMDIFRSTNGRIWY